MDEIEHTYDGKFEGNILVVGRTACGKTCLETSPRFIGYLKVFCWNEGKRLLEKVFIVKKFILTIQQT